MPDPAGERSFLLRIAEPETREQGAGLAGTGQNTARSCRIEGVWSSYTYALPCMSIRIAVIVIQASRSYPGARTLINSPLGA
jgi:hypothetical protein